MKNSITYTIAILLAAIFFTLNINAQEVFLPHYTTKNGLPSNNCYYTLQDRKGFIWIATEAGVSRFDGTVFENFSVDDGLPDNQILQLKEDSKGRIWFMALNGQLSYFYNGKIHNEKNDLLLKDLNLNGVVVSSLEDAKENLWFATNNNIIAFWNGKTTTKIIPKKGLKLQNSFLFEDDFGKIKAINNFGNYTFNGTDFQIDKTIASTLSYKTIQKKEKQIYFLNRDGINVLSKGNVTKLIPINESLFKNIGYIYVSKDKFWLTSSSGASLFTNTGKVENYLNGIVVNQLIEDRNGNMWFTTANGVYKLPHVNDQLNIFKLYDKDNAFKSIAGDTQERLWLGGTNGNIAILDVEKNKHFNLNVDHRQSFSIIKQLKFDAVNDKMFFASEYGLGNISANYPTDKKIDYLKEKNDKVFVIKNFAIDSTSKIALAMSSGVAIIKDRKKLEFSSLQFKEGVDFFRDRAYRVYFDKQQQLWFSNVSGLASNNHHKLDKYYQKYPILSKRINDMAQLPDGTMALATDGYGIILLKDRKIVNVINHECGLINNIVHKLFAKNADLWAITNNGLNKINFSDNQFKIKTFDNINGLLSSDLNDLYIGERYAYFATNNGLVYFDHAKLKQVTLPPTLHITSLINNGNVLPLTRTTYVLKPNNQNLTINYSAIDFKHRNVNYRYRLREDADWIETKNRKLEFSNLEPGAYLVEISAKSQNSEWSSPAKISLRLEKHFYQKWWFISISALLAGYLIYFIGVRITRQQKNKEQEQLLLRNKILMLEQQALQAMMNPHFVFNVMNSIQHYINTQNTNSANKVLTGFARLIRKNLEICTKSYISLEEEINYLNLYLSLEKNRFGEKLQFEINVSKDIDKEETFIPSMLLQPFVENAIWHGIMPLENGGKVCIDIALIDDDTLCIKITDDGIGIDNALASKNNNHQSKGMQLTKERIALLNKIEVKSIQFEVKQNGKSGTIVELKLPIM